MLMRRVVGDAMGVKAAGGVRDLEQMKAMVAAGATRVGASAGVRIVKESRGESLTAAETGVVLITKFGREDRVAVNYHVIRISAWRASEPNAGFRNCARRRRPFGPHFRNLGDPAFRARPPGRPRKGAAGAAERGERRQAAARAAKDVGGQKRAVSERMKKYWAARRKAEG